MKELTINQIIEAVQADEANLVRKEVVVKSVQFDSRLVSEGSLFIPLSGGATDGHDYVEQVIEQGATVTFWEKDKENPPKGKINVIYVDDSLKAMQQLAHYYRHLLDPIVIGITGSNGKTTTKDMLANVLKQTYKVHQTAGNYNNEIGLPYTVLSMPASTEVLIVEMGMSGYGEIQELSEIANPDYGIITLIGESHLEHLGSSEGIAKAKLEILSGMSQQAMLIYPENQQLIVDQLPPTVPTLTVGFERGVLRATNIQEYQEKTTFQTNLTDQKTLSIPILGKYNVSNALLALSVAKELAVPMEQAVEGLATFQLTANRVQWMKTHQNALLLNDAYNASPTSMEAVLKTFSHLTATENQRKIIVLGDIRELGNNSASLHRRLETFINPELINEVYLFGTEMSVLHEVLVTKFQPDKLHYVPQSHQQLIEKLNTSIVKGDLILVKSSYGTDLLQVVQALTEKPLVESIGEA